MGSESDLSWAKTHAMNVRFAIYMTFDRAQPF